ncbi:MAG TPA: hypothetical protein DEQ72_10475 [Lachnospiraceae bacterium]|nr:hypothetical protein [Lachnospiraceae bacterium]
MTQTRHAQKTCAERMRNMPRRGDRLWLCAAYCILQRCLVTRLQAPCRPFFHTNGGKWKPPSGFLRRA